MLLWSMVVILRLVSLNWSGSLGTFANRVRSREVSLNSFVNLVSFVKVGFSIPEFVKVRY